MTGRLKKRFHPLDPVGTTRVLIASALAMLAAGLIMLGSASSVRAAKISGDNLYFVKRQAVWALAGLAVGAIAAMIPYRKWRAAAIPLAVVSAVLLILVLVAGRRAGGSVRWINVGPAGFQPSEIAKFAVVNMLAFWISTVPHRFRKFREGILLPGAAVAPFVLLILLEPDFGTAVLIALLSGLMLFVAASKRRWLILGAMAGFLILLVYLKHDPVRWKRIMAWRHPEQYKDIAYHALSSITAFITGGWKGVGYLQGMAKHLYLPEVHTDFIYAVVGEEFGIMGTLGVLLLFGAFLICGSLISLRAPDLYGRLLAFGITASITVQALLNMYVVTGLLPTKGIPLPFFSYGGSSLMVSLFQVGVLVNIGIHGQQDAIPIARPREIWDALSDPARRFLALFGVGRNASLARENIARLGFQPRLLLLERNPFSAMIHAWSLASAGFEVIKSSDSAMLENTISGKGPFHVILSATRFRSGCPAETLRRLLLHDSIPQDTLIIGMSTNPRDRRLWAGVAHSGGFLDMDDIHNLGSVVMSHYVNFRLDANPLWRSRMPESDSGGCAATDISAS